MLQQRADNLDAGFSGATAVPPPMRASLISLLLRVLLLAGALLAGLGVAPAARADAPATLELADGQRIVDAWPAVRTLADPGGRLDWQAALARLPSFTVPAGPARNLGNQRDPVWLALPLRAAAGDGQWVFDIDYPALNEARVHVIADGRLVREVMLGSAQAYEARPMRTRTHAVTLALEPGVPYLLLVRVRTASAMVLPVTLSKPGAYHEREAGRWLSHGLTFGLSLALLAYCVVYGISLRDRLFPLYAALLLASSAFFIDFTGLGQVFLWSERSGMVAMISPLSVLLAMAAGGAFVMQALDTRRVSPRLHRGLVALSTISALLLVAGVVGLLDYRQAQMLAASLGPFVPLLVIPAAWRRARSGDPMGLYMLLGWSCYVVGALSAACLLRGLLPANFLTLHLFQWTSLLEMLAWLRVLSLHVDAVRREAERSAAAVRDLSALAHTDALTGLPNRRGLDAALAAALERVEPGSLLAIYLIDLDGFKAVNDSLGHAAGDALLIEVGRRLVRELRRSDVVARLGGDEFVVLAGGLSAEAEAHVVGRKLMGAFSEPVKVDGRPCRIGLTVGYALAPLDGRLPADLLRTADAAMYAGKRAGRQRLLRGGDAAAVPA